MRSFLHDTKLIGSGVNREDSQSVDLLRSGSSSSNGNDDMDEDDESVDPALASAAQSQRAARGKSKSREEPRYSASNRKPQAPVYSDSYDQGPASTAYVTSPATQTLNALAQSQESVDLHYDLSQLEYDVVAALVQTKKIRVDPRDGDVDDPSDDPMGSRISHATSQFNQAKEKMRTASKLSASTTAATSSIKSRPRVKAARDQLVPALHCSKNMSSTNARSANAIGKLSKVAVSSNQSLSRTSKSASNGNSTTARSRLLPTRTTMAAPPSLEVNGKRGRLPESDRRDILQISVRTGLIVRKFASFSEAGKAVGFSRHIVASILRGTYKTNEYKGWTFRFVDDENNDNQGTKSGKMSLQDCDQEDETDDDIDDGASVDVGRWSGKIESLDTIDSRRRKTYNRIAHIDLASGGIIGSYPSFVVAAEHTGVSRQRISSMVKGELDAFDGSTFRYETDPEPFVHAPPPPGKKEPIPEATHSSSSGRLRNLRQTLTSLTAKPVTERPTDVQLVRTTSPSRVRSSKAAISVEELDAATGKVLHTYRSLTLASEHSGANRHIISNVLKGKVESWKGKKWRYSTVTDEDDVFETAIEAYENRSDYKDDICSESDPRIQEKRRAQTEASGMATKIHKVNTKIATSTSGTAQPNDGNDDSIVTPTEHESKKLRRVSDDPSDSPSLIAAENSLDEDNRQDTTITSTSSFDESEFVTLNAVFERAGELGITVTKKQAPNSLLSFLQIVHGVEESNVGVVQMFVEEMVTPSVASTAGVKRGDYILYPKQDPIESSVTIFADYSVVVDAIRAEKRPCNFLVARLKSFSSVVPHNLSSAKTVDQMTPSLKPNEDKAEMPSSSFSSSKGEASHSSPSKNGAKHSKGSTQNSAQHEKASTDGQGGEKDKEIVPQMIVAKISTLSTSIDTNIEISSEVEVVAGNTKPLVPSFCLLCSGTAPKSRAQHHPWCPKNPQHESAGADDVLKAIFAGIAMGCCFCKEEYERGRRKDKRKHLKGCPRRQLTVSSSATLYKTTTKKRKSEVAGNMTQLVCESPSICRSTGVYGDEDDDSAYASLSKNSGPYKKLVLLKPKCDGTIGASRSSKSIVEKLLNKESMNATSRSIAMPAVPKSHLAINSVDGLPAESIDSVALQNSVTAVPLNSVAVEEDYDDWDDDCASNEKLAVVWEDCQNPWGRDGHMDDDVILFSSSQRFWHPETLFMAQRYEEYPFSSHQRYRQTHLSPENGYQALVLRRDALAQRPWGFTCHHHEFGGACLVFSVDPLSPAWAATLLGNGPDAKEAAPLCVNDMILAIDGRFIGGMTTVSVEIALEQAGPELVLLVSRYIFASGRENTATAVEKSTLKHADALVNDERLLGWIDLCNGPSTKEHLAVVAPQNTPAFVAELTPGQKIAMPSNTTIDISRPCAPKEHRGRFRPLDDADVDSIDGRKKEVSVAGCTFDQQNSVPRQAESTEIHIADSSLLNDEREADDTSSGESSGYPDDGNAWLGCVCGEIHEPCGQHKEIFWLQCDDCWSWYDSSSHCLGFTEIQAKSRAGWSCWTCTDAREIETQPKSASTVVESSNGGIFLSPASGTKRATSQEESVISVEESPRGGRVSISPTMEASVDKDITLPACEVETKPASSDVRFGNGDFVFIKEHAWPGVNNPEGIAKVISFRFDEDGDMVYDIKYVVGGTRKGVHAEYVSRHSFE